jgi:uncharacterized metal-binding protein
VSRKLFAFLLSELKTVRVICSRSGCRSVTEVDLSKLDSVGNKEVCPVCQQDLFKHSSEDVNPLVKLAEGIRMVQEAQTKAGAAQIEFVLPDASAS